MSDEIQEQTPHTGRFDIGWLVSCIMITAAATALRFVMLGLKPLHHDEGVNGWFLTNLFRDGEYKYDPANYHGPTLYYISLAFTKVFGLETLPIRWSVAVWGVLIVVLALFLRRYIGRVGALAAAGFLTLSPGMVYISRYFIHEIFFVFLSIAIAVAIVFFIEKKKAGPFAIAWMSLILLVCFLPSTMHISDSLSGGDESKYWIYAAVFFAVEAVLVFFVIRMLLVWENGRPVYLLLAAASTSLLFATKETAFITLGTMMIAAGLVWFWRRTYKSRPGEDGEIE
ncbi:MAG: TIGR03663 family protein, partial [Pyrinomonadaceae bacterium]|nr:TIGR03663 family protein [Pyrinomonadaceae bacterium]